MKIKYKRLVTLISAILILLGVVLFITTVFRNNIRYFATPTQVITENLKTHKHLRIGAVVKEKTWKRTDLQHTFTLTDGRNEVTVTHTGMLPDLFREGQTIVVEGHFEGEIFKASQVLAKHDENYKPPLLSKDAQS